jgi:hypothetical protein
MANRIKQGVSIKVHPLYFDNIFEPERKRLQNKLGVSFSQSKFTEYLAKSNAKIVYPKQRNNFAPKRKRNGGLAFTL